MSHASPIDEPRWAGVREVTAMSWPIVLGMASYSVMEFTDKYMVAKLGAAPLAAVGAAGLWSYTLSTFLLGIVGCVSTFVAQSVGRGQPHQSGSYAWQGIWLSLLAGLLVMILWPLAEPLFRLMNHGDDVLPLEVTFFKIRLFGYWPMVWAMGLGAFFQATGHPRVTMYSALAGNIVNLVLNYLLIFGEPRLGIPRMGVAGSAIATVVSQFLQVAILQALFLSRRLDAEFHTRSTWRPHARRLRELIRIGVPGGGAMLMDVCNWAIFVAFIVGHFGAHQLAANNIAISYMQLSFMPALAINQGIAAIVGRWIGAGDIPRAKARTYTAVRMACAYMLTMGVSVALFRAPLVAWFTNDPAVAALGMKLLILAAIFQGFDAISIVLMGALRGAGDTRWILITTSIAAYLVFLPATWIGAITLNGGAFGAWVSAAIYILAWSAVFFLRFHGEAWRHIQIFTPDHPHPQDTPKPANEPAPA